jgi:hypothetical protein
LVLNAIGRFKADIVHIISPHGEFPDIMKRILVPAAAVSAFLMPCAGSAATLHVPSGYPTIQLALDAAAPGDTVEVTSGTYTENLAFNGTNLRLTSADPLDTATVAATIIDGNSSGSVITLAGIEDASCVIEGFTIRNGYAPLGGGIRCNWAAATIRNNVITSNTAYGTYPDGGGGGGIFATSGDVLFNHITSNTAGYRGGGIGASSYGIVCGNLIEYNQVIPPPGPNSSIGGGVDGITNLLGNTIRFNNAAYGGGVAFTNHVTGNLIVNNTANYGGGIAEPFSVVCGNTIADNTGVYDSGGVLFVDQSTFFTNNIVWGNSAPLHPQHEPHPEQFFFSCVQGGAAGGVGNLNTDPLFVDAANGDYRLQAESPCIDAGSLWYVWPQPYVCPDGYGRLSGTAMDMGAYEFGAQPDADGDLLADTDEATTGSNPAVTDTDGDGLVDGAEALRGTIATAAEAPSGIAVATTAESIQRAMFLTFRDEAVTLSPGVYDESLFMLGRSYTVQGTNPDSTATVATTVVDGGARHATINYSDYEPYTHVTRGITIRNGSSVRGGGVRAYGGAMLDRCVLTSNTSARGGGANGSNMVFIGCTITSNTAVRSGGVDGGNLNRCTVTGNTAADTCGGADVLSAHNSIIAGNSAQTVGGIRSSDLIHCVVYGNQASSSVGGATASYTAHANIVWANNAPAAPQYSGSPQYSCVQSGVAGPGNISGDPLFVDAAAGDFSLQQGSPCIDAAPYIPFLWAQTDFSGSARPYDDPNLPGPGYDMGAFEMRYGLARVADWEIM